MKNIFGAIVVGISFALPAYAGWPADSIAIGVRDNPKILSRFGGAIPEGKLTNYVSQIGHQIAQHSDFPDEDWQFVVLNSDAANAFALPGGYIYVTRGLLALAKDRSMEKQVTEQITLDFYTDFV